MANSLVSVFFPVYQVRHIDYAGNPERLHLVVNSVLEQTYENLELIILNNQKNLSVTETLESLVGADRRIRYICAEDALSPEQSVEHLASVAKGEYCLVADIDVIFQPQYIDKLVACIQRDQSIGVVSSNGCYEGTHNQLLIPITSGNTLTISDVSRLSRLRQFSLREYLIPLASGLYRTTLFREASPYQPLFDLDYRGHSLFLAKVALCNHVIFFLPDILYSFQYAPSTLYPFGQQELMNKPLSMLLEQIYRRFDIFRSTVNLLDRTNFNRFQKGHAWEICADTFLRACSDVITIAIDKTGTKCKPIISINLKFQKQVSRYLLDPSLFGNFSDDDPASVRFQPPIVCGVMGQSVNGLKALSRIIGHALGGPDRLKEWGTLGKELWEEADKLGKEAAELSRQIVVRPGILDRKKPKVLSQRERPPLVTIISCSMNTARFLEETLNSVENQTFQDYEHIIVDGGSTDGTLEILKKYPQLVVISESDNGYQDAFCKGLRIARGKYIAQCCISDGYLDPNWIKRCVDALEADETISLVWGFPQYMTEDSRMGAVSYPQFHCRMPPQGQEFISFWLDTSFYVPEGNFYVRTDVLKECFPVYDSAITEDYDPWLEFNYRFNSKGYLNRHIPIIANFGRIHGNQLGQQERKKGVGRLRSQNYFDKVSAYRRKIITSQVNHVFRDGHHRSLKSSLIYKPCTYALPGIEKSWKQIVRVVAQKVLGYRISDLLENYYQRLAR